jgi:hypothetical protein
MKAPAPAADGQDCSTATGDLLCPLYVDPRHTTARDQRPLRVTPKSARAYSRSADKAAQYDGVSMLRSRLDVPVTVWRTPSAATWPRSYLRTSMLNAAGPYSRRGRHLSAARRRQRVELRRATGRDSSGCAVALHDLFRI